MYTHGHEITTLGNRASYYEYSIAYEYLYKPYYDIYVEEATRRLPFHAVSGQTNLSKLSFS